MANAIEGIGLAKTFLKRRSIRDLILHPSRPAERVEALKGVDLDVREGEIVGLLGPNGAGKTTLLKILSCLVLPDRGRAVIGGHDTRDEYRVKRTIGLVNSDERSFYWRLSGRENLRFFARLYDVPRRGTAARIDELLRRVDMLGAADRPFADYSSGMKQRMAIVRALLHDPPILLMDEPTRSLDPASAITLRTFILDELNGRLDKTILLATHNLREAEVLAGRVAILAAGRIRFVGTVPEVRSRGVRRDTYRLETRAGAVLPDGPFDVVVDATADGRRRTTITLRDGARLDDVLRCLVRAEVSIDGCDRVEPDLEQAFSRILDAPEEPA